MADQKKTDLFGKARGAISGMGSKVDKSIGDIKNKVTPATEKVADGFKEQSVKVKATVETAAKGVQNSLKETSEGRNKNKNEHTIVKLAGTDMKILLPDGYEKIKYSNPIRGMVKNLANTDAAFRKTVSTSDNIVLITKAKADFAMDPDDLQRMIDGIHANLSDEQGIIEAKNGESARGYKYIYSIVKTLSKDQPGGCMYYIRANLFHDKDILEMDATFTEINMTGQREAICVELAKRAGLADVFTDGFKDWAKDPYDPEYTKGCLKNLSEKEGLDGLFPEHPLTQAHELLLAVLEDKFAATRDEVPEEYKKEESDQNEESLEGVSDEERLRQLFVDECRRYTYPIEMEEFKQDEGENKPHKEPQNKDNYIKKKKNMNFQSVEAMQSVVNVVNEAAAALNDKGRTIRESAIPEVLAGALGAGIGGVGSFAALYGFGVVGLSAAGITSGLATAGAVVGGGMAAGVFVLAAPVAGLATAGVGVAAHLKNKQLRQEKERLYKEALIKHEAIIKAMKEEADADKERMDYLQSLNILLQQAIKDLQHDLGVSEGDDEQV